MKLKDIIDALRDGGTLRLSLAKKPRWELYYGATIKTVSSTQAQSLIKRGAITAAGDSLFPDSIPSQTWWSAP